ncbi:MAG: FAD-dependent oxidoreductase [Peptococcaceae bacterium]
MRKWMLMIVLLAALLYGCGNTEKYDVIVVGGDPEGISAAVTAARNGMNTLLVEDDEALGGLMTLGELNFIDMCTGDDGTLLTRGTFLEFYNAVGGTAFDIPTAKQVFLQMVENEENLTLKLDTACIKPVMKGDAITGVILQQDGRKITCKADCVIDATVDADVAAAAGVPYTYLGQDYGQTENVTGVTLVFELSGVNWNAVSQYLNSDNNPNTGCTDKAAWGYNEESFAYVPQDSQTRLRGLNIALQNNGNVLINGFIIFGVDPLDEDSKEAGIARGKAELQHIIPYLQQNYVGFENAALVDTASQLYVRESRHILGEYQLTLDDVLENRWFDDTIAIGSYPVDVPPNAQRKVGMIIGAPDRYGVPFRCLVPQEIDGLLVVGRSASYTSLAAGSARVIPLGMAEGDAAGVAAAYAKNNHMTFREISQSIDAVASIQQSLREQGAYLEQWDPIVMDVEQHWAYEGLKTLRSLGLVYGGYANDYRLEDPITREEFFPMLQGLGDTIVLSPDFSEDEARPLTCSEILYMLENTLQMVPLGNLQQAGVLTEQLQPYFADEQKVPARAEVVMLMANAYAYAEQQGSPE